MIIPLTTPVALIIFNRPAKTQHVFEAIARAKPPALYIVADGARTPDEESLCQQTRAVVAAVDWDCQVFTNYAETNMGCRRRVSSGLDWVFRHCERAIILEDDCVPDPTFFPFCEELLTRYQDDERIMTIGGSNHLKHPVQSRNSYYVSIFPHIWGWASWARAWRHYDVGMTQWQSLRDTNWLHGLGHTADAVTYWREIFDVTSQGKIDTWDYQWTFASWLAHGLSIMPTHNLITNIGFDASATHTTDPDGLDFRLKVRPMTFPLRHPQTLVLNPAREARIGSWFMGRRPFDFRVRRRVRRMLHAARRLL